MEIGRRHWILAICGAALIHAGVAAAMLWLPRDAGAQSVDFGGVEVALVSAGEAAGGETPPVSAEAEGEPVEASTNVPTEPLPENVEVIDPAEVETAVAPDVAEMVEPDTIPEEIETAEVAEIAETHPPEPVEADAIEVAEAVPVETPLEEAEAVEPEAVEAKALMPMPPVRPKDLPKVARAEPERRAAPQRQAAPRPHASQPAASAPSRQSVSGAGAQADASAIRRYSAELAAALRSRLRYPSAARARRIEGVATVRFTVDTSGRVLASSLVGSAGDASLDQAALATVAVGSRLPAPPVGGGSLTVSVPLRFAIR